MEEKSIAELKAMSTRVRKDLLDALYHAGSGHPGGALSSVEILVALYFRCMRVDPENPTWEDRDRLVFSKGHACPALYAVLAERGFFDLEVLKTLRKPDSILQGHPVWGKVPGVDTCSGSLGQGASIAGGMALYGKKRHRDYKVFCVLGDGESEEGQVWAAAMSAGHFGLNNLIVILDNNDLQIDGRVRDIMSIYPVIDKYRAFNFDTIEVSDGNDIEQVIDAIELARKSTGRPTFIQCHTVKGKGVPLLENKVDSHGRTITKEILEQAVAGLDAAEGGAAE